MATNTRPPRTLARNARRFASALLVIPLIAFALPAAPAHAAVSDWQQKGISFYPYSPTDFSSSGFRASVDHYKSLGFNTITLVIPLYQSNTGSTDIGPGGNTPTDESLTSGIEYAHAQGMKVMLKVHLDPRTGDWRAYINPGDRDGWYANYLSMLEHYGAIAEQEHVEAICMGTELIDMASAAVNPDNTERWQNMITQLRTVYHGQLTYDANWGTDKQVGEASYIGFWPSLDFAGISAYYPLSGDGSVQQNEWAWAGWQANEIDAIHAKAGIPVVFTEIGYRSVTNARQAPFNSGMGGAYDPQEQVNDYQALLDYWNQQSYMQGIDIWYGTSDPNAGGSGNTDYFVSNKPVESTLKTWFAGSGATSTPAGPAAAFTITGSSSPANPAAGSAVTSSISATDTGGQAWGANVDLEVYDASGHQVAQKIFDSQDFAAGQEKSYSFSWTPAGSGTYTLKAGVFDSSWNLYTWNDAAATIAVGGSPAGGNTGGTGTTTPPSNEPAVFTAAGSAPQTATAGQELSLSANLTDTGGQARGTNVDLEVYDASGHQWFQKIYASQDFSAGQSRTYVGAWTPTGTGTYTFKIGVFDKDWNLYTWNDGAAQIAVSGSTSTGGAGGTGTSTDNGGGPTTPPASASIDIWWPTDGANISGLQPFKALVPELSLSDYSMFWKVDGGQENPMNDSQTDAPHKEALVDVGSWTWKGNGPYSLTFTAKDGAGATLAERTISIYVVH